MTTSNFEFNTSDHRTVRTRIRVDTEALVSYVVKNPGKSPSEIARAVGRNPVVVNAALDRLFGEHRLLRLYGFGPRGGFVYF